MLHVVVLSLAHTHTHTHTHKHTHRFHSCFWCLSIFPRAHQLLSISRVSVGVQLVGASRLDTEEQSRKHKEFWCSPQNWSIVAVVLRFSERVIKKYVVMSHFFLLLFNWDGKKSNIFGKGGKKYLLNTESFLISEVILNIIFKDLTPGLILSFKAFIQSNDYSVKMCLDLILSTECFRHLNVNIFWFANSSRSSMILNKLYVGIWLVGGQHRTWRRHHGFFELWWRVFPSFWH